MASACARIRSEQLGTTASGGTASSRWLTGECGGGPAKFWASRSLVGLMLVGAVMSL